MKNNIIDIGSNSVRMYTFGQKTVITTRLAENMTDDRLDKAAMDRTVKAIQLLCNNANGNCYAFATAAVRRAQNQEEFLQLVKENTGLCVDVISEQEEAEISFIGATMKCDSDQAAYVIDLGGASCETVQGQDLKPSYSNSLPFGCVTLKDQFGDDLIAIDRYVKKNYIINAFIADIYLVVGGTATALAAMDLKLKEYDTEKVNGHYLYTHDITNLINELKAGKEFPTLSSQRRKTILQGAAALRAILGCLNISCIEVSDKDSLEGYAIKHRLL